MKNVIRLGDPTTHGGRVITARAAHFTVHGIAVASVGDQCSCPIPGHGTTNIIEGNPCHTIDGIEVAYDGHKTSCGAQLIPTLDDFSADC
jgi:uncharacterized Zn-binding protein involved in type VI secretion